MSGREFPSPRDGDEVPVITEGQRPPVPPKRAAHIRLVRRMRMREAAWLYRHVTPGPRFPVRFVAAVVIGLVVVLVFLVVFARSSLAASAGRAEQWETRLGSGTGLSHSFKVAVKSDLGVSARVPLCRPGEQFAVELYRWETVLHFIGKWKRVGSQRTLFCHSGRYSGYEWAHVKSGTYEVAIAGRSVSHVVAGTRGLRAGGWLCSGGARLTSKGGCS